MEEFHIAHEKMIHVKGKGDKSRFLIPILLEDIPPATLDKHKELRTYLRTHTYIDARKYDKFSPHDIDRLRKHIRFAMPDTPLKTLQIQTRNNEDVEGIGQNIQLEDHENVERVEADGEILRLLEADGTIHEVRVPEKRQTESSDEESDTGSEGEQVMK